MRQLGEIKAPRTKLLSVGSGIAARWRCSVFSITARRDFREARKGKAGGVGQGDATSTRVGKEEGDTENR